MEKTKKCSGCKKVEKLSDFYKNKLTLDGHSTYCIKCTKDNSRKYNQRKKEKSIKIEGDDRIRNFVLETLPVLKNDNRIESMIKIMMVETLCKTILDTLIDLKETILRPKETE